MSCTVIAVPIALAHIIGVAIAASGVAAIQAASQLEKSEKEKQLEQYTQDIENSFFNNIENLQVSDIIEKEFQTVYMDKDILLKTLEEHGVIDIEEAYDGTISGSISSFTLNFHKPSETEPYNLRITCKESDNAEEKLDDLNAEYALNVQEEAYLNLIENLKENNMEIEEEVVEEDNTIVLTINLE